MFDREMRYMAASRRWLDDLSLTEEEAIGRSHYEGISNLPKRYKEAHRRGLAGEAVEIEEDEIERPDGTVAWVRWYVRPWRTGHGDVGGIIIFGEDITERKLADMALRESKEILQLFIENAPVSLAMFDREMRYLAVSRLWAEDHSFDAKEFIGRSHYEINPNALERWGEAHRRGLAGETLRADEDRFVRADGSVQWSRLEVAPWRTGDGSVGGIVLFAENITAHKQAEERLHLAASVFTGAREGITITDPEGTIMEVNDAFTRITGYTREEVLGHNPRLLKSGLQSRTFYENMWRSLIETGRWSGEIWNRAKNGNLYEEMLSINAIRDASGNTLKYVAHITDLTEIKKRERELEHIAHFDTLTGLPNRTLFADRLRQAMVHVHRRKQLLAVAYIDLDGFKEINDRHGRDAGDRLLAALAEHMRDALREGDTLARLGGDEFVAVLLDLTGVEDSAPVLARLLAAVSEEVQVADRTLQVSASMGVTFYPQAEEVDADLLLRQADQAICQAKLAGRSRFHNFDPTLDLTVRGRNENIDHIRRALAANQFVLYYHQPKANMRTGAVIGAEALIRWQHPERGLLPPEMFLPVIEDHPIAIDLGEWVIDAALAQAETWQVAGLNIPVSVNVGALQLQQPDFVDRLKALLAAHPRVKASDLELEVLETSALQDLVQTSQLLQACREMGVPVALDDFGTGYSLLTYLKRLPTGILKIDQSFVSGIAVDPEDLAILEGLLGLAAAFRQQVVAEGVETVDHGLMLLQMGCELAEGYAIAPPIPAGDLPA
jgi:diguanylate cyclase (GGDEF)-like protein/PAS domain S-box-containing protein